ncbi:LolA-like outer membrane lipoprotein chaperone [Campylobacter ureolyticus]|uniref:LolA-like outer membrane lipoprotein chaperone n=1 Tax=Campylobacter ureolyticus TaxID=827 RepID=UPI0022B2C0CA|nr:LolA-like outer membrane lipoprotein chaperone [Campylobacter ureolyticus]MCZ6116377.1 LolA-like outer membrane lipoprotein chaperone [Campylobacter ureolyticus]
MKKIYFLTAFLLFCVNLAFASPLEFKTLQSNFTQTVKNNENKIKYSGNFIATLNSALWSYKTPNLKDIYFNYEKVIIVEPDLEQAIITNLSDVPNLMDILKDAKKIDKNNYEAKFDGINYNLKFKDEILDEISYIDKLDNEILIKFTNLKKDEFIDKSLLTPKIPSNFDLITK